MSASALVISAPLFRIFHRRSPRQSGSAADLTALLQRIRRRLYHENVPVLASSWLNTVYYAGHNRPWWVALDAAIEEAIPIQNPGATADTIREIQAWVRQSILARQKAPKVEPLLHPPFRDDLTSDQAGPYLSRLLNEWLPKELARLLTSEPEFPGSNESAIPELAVATALERVLLREHHSPATLELLLQAAWVSPQYAYPAHLEIFCDVVHALLGRIAAPDPPVLPAIHLAGEFAASVSRASLVCSEDGEELHVPLEASQVAEVLKHDPISIGSIVVTTDGRWWESVRLQRGDESVIVYRPGGRLRIDFSCEHARLVVPWPDFAGPSPGVVHLPDHFSLFGREWRGLAWERSAERTWLHLEFSRALTIPETLTSDNPRRPCLRPASTEMAWSEVEQALVMGTPDSIDQLHHTDLIPLARALERLIASLLGPWPVYVPVIRVAREDIERSLRSVRYLHGTVAPVYGRIPWRVLPARPRTVLIKRLGDTARDLVGETFDGAMPEEGTSRRAA
jgi:hypothetical protein